jgi:aryl-alcohol dehydrogenase-like predicted oxidoreductase
VLAQGTDIVPIPGTRRIANLEENAVAVDITLSDYDLATIDQVAPVGIAAGERYAPGGMQAVHR